MRMGYRTAYDQPTQHEYYPNRFGAYGAVMRNPYGSTEEKPKGTLGTAIDLYLEGLKDGDLESYAFPAGALVFALPKLMKKQFDGQSKAKKRQRQAMYFLGSLAMFYSVGYNFYTAYKMVNPPSV